MTVTIFNNCGCFRCTSQRVKDVPGDTIMGQPVELMRIFVCEQCGNKRCPHAADHHNLCTSSNAPGQIGSMYEAVDDDPVAPQYFDYRKKSDLVDLRAEIGCLTKNQQAFIYTVMIDARIIVPIEWWAKLICWAHRKKYGNTLAIWTTIAVTHPKQHSAAIERLCQWLVEGNATGTNNAAGGFNQKELGILVAAISKAKEVFS